MVAPDALAEKYNIGQKIDTGPEIDTGRPVRGATTRVAPTANNVIAENNSPQPLFDKTVGDMVAAFKSITTVEYIHGVKNSRWQPFNGKLWQRNYYEHIIWNEHSYENIADYINCNASRWAIDKFYDI